MILEECFEYATKMRLHPADLFAQNINMTIDSANYPYGCLHYSEEKIVLFNLQNHNLTLNNSANIKNICISSKVFLILMSIECLIFFFIIFFNRLVRFWLVCFEKTTISILKTQIQFYDRYLKK